VYDRRPLRWRGAHGDWSELRGSLWLKPALAVALALATGALLSRVVLPEDSLLGSMVFRGDADDARQLLTAVTQTMITVTSLVFVLTVVALQIASSQFSPRLLRTFLRDRGTQLVLSTFVGTVAYSLAGLHTVGSPSVGGQAFVPRLAVTGSLLLALISVGMLVYYIQHITDSIRIDTIMRQVETTTLSVVRRAMPLRAPHPVPVLPEIPAAAEPVLALRSGYVQRFRLGGLLNLAASHDATICVSEMIGSHVVRGCPIAWIWGAPADRFTRAVANAVVIDHERKAEHDIGFGLRQLVDIAGRTLSPSLNDPYSAVQSLHHLTVVLGEMARRTPFPIVLHDARGEVRVAAPTVDFADYLQTTCSHVRWSMTHRPRVALALLRLIENVATLTDDETKLAAMAAEIDLVVGDAERMIPNATDLAMVRAGAEAARRAVAGGRKTLKEVWAPDVAG
jgi:uncharacterized membrane protein